MHQVVMPADGMFGFVGLGPITLAPAIECPRRNFDVDRMKSWVNTLVKK
jgi:hypothetical protein